VVATIERAILALRRQRPVDDALLNMSPLGWKHINLTGDYVWRAPTSELPQDVFDPFDSQRYKRSRLSVHKFPFLEFSPKVLAYYTSYVYYVYVINQTLTDFGGTMAILKVLALLLVAVTMGLSLAHALEFPGKIASRRADVQGCSGDLLSGLHNRRPRG
jgi:hypothetical protein